MNRYLRRTLLGSAFVSIVGCSTPVFYHIDPGRHIVVLDREPISVLQLGESQWEAWGGGSSRLSSESNERLDRQIKAIEIVSGCSVTGSTIDPDDARKLTATVTCRESVDESFPPRKQ